MLKLAGELIEGQLADHVARLDAHTINLYEQFAVGQYLPLPLVYISYDLTMVQYRLYATYIVVARDMTFDRIAIDIETLDNGKDIRLGIYNCNSSLEPSSLVQDCGTVDTDSTGLKAITLDPAVSLTKGRYFLAAITDSDGVAKVVNATPYSGGLGLSTNFDRARTGYQVTKTATEFAALGDPFGAANLDTASPVIGLRVESLD